ncbi:MAG: NUDIX domain-containing protein [Ignavibacteriaceae bacterium]
MKIISNMIEAHIFRESDKGIEFLLLKRSEKEIYPGLWQMVTGKIHEGEKAYEAALREIKEETGLVPERFWVAPNVNQFYSHEGNYISLMPVFAAKAGNKFDVIMCDEHCDCKWVTPEEAKKLLAWPGQRKSVDIIVEYITKEISFLNFTEIKINM